MDYVTHEARYSLSEEKLIRQQVNENESDDGVVSQESESVEYKVKVPQLLRLSVPRLSIARSPSLSRCLRRQST